MERKLTRREFLKHGRAWGIMAGLSLAGVGAYASLWEPFSLEVRPVRISLSSLPEAFQGFRIVLFSDLHLGYHFPSQLVREMVETIRQLNPDLILFAGDLLDSQGDRSALDSDGSLLGEFRPPYGKYAVLGNHDYWTGANRATATLRKTGFKVLRNTRTVIQKGTDRLYLAGLDDAVKGHPDWKSALRGIPKGGCTILAIHQPDTADTTKLFPVALQLSGHSHGGQIRLPWVGAVFTPKKGHKYVTGLYRVPGSDLQVYTTRGLGTTHLPFRFLSPPEITVITLEK